MRSAIRSDRPRDDSSTTDRPIRAVAPRLLGVLGLFLGAFVLLLGLDIVWSYRAERREAERQSVELVHLLEAQTARMVDATDLLLLHMAELAAETDWTRPGAAAALQPRLADLRSRVPFAVGFGIVDPEGRMRVTESDAAPGAVVADRRYFSVHRTDSHAGLFISELFRARFGGHAGQDAFVLSRGLSFPTGTFAGVVAVAFSPAELAAYFRSLGTRYDATFLLLGGDLSILLREPASPEAAPIGGLAAPALREALAQAPAGTLRSRSHDGAERLWSYHRIEDYPLTVAVGFTTASIAAEWFREAAPHVGVALLALAVLSGLGVAALRQARREDRLRARLVSAEALARTEASRRQAETLLQDVVDHSSAVIYVKDRAGRYLLTNQFYDVLMRTTRDKVAGRTDFDLFPPQTAERLAANDQLVAERGEAIDFEEDVPLQNGVRRYLAHKFPLRGPDGRIYAVCGIGTDITERTRTEAALHERDERLRAALSASGTGTYRWDLRSDEIDRDENLLRLYGLAPGETASRLLDLARWVHPDDLAAVLAAVERARRGEADFDIDYRVVWPDGSVRWLTERGKPVFDAEGRPLYLTGACTDITERKRAQEQQRLLMAELNHRVKNTLAVVQAIARQTLRRSSSLEGFAAAFGGRLRALAAAHGLLTQGHWESAGLEAILQESLRPLLAQGARTVRRQGPSLALPPRQTLALSLVFHELATNAAKYGALSMPTGEVEIGWSLEAAAPDGERILRISWRESGGPPAAAPGGAGFGMTLIRRTIEYDLGGAATLAFRSEGLVCEIRLPLRAARDEADHRPSVAADRGGEAAPPPGPVASASPAS